MNQPLQIKKATTEDIGLIRNLTMKIWPQTYQRILSPEQTAYMLEMMYSPASLESQFAEGANFILVYRGDNPVGFAAYKAMEKGIYKLEKIYILANEQGKGTGKFLLQYIESDIHKKNGRSLQLQVNRFNNNAKSFYEKNGFTVVQEADFDIGNGYYMKDFVMEKKLG